MESEYAIHHYVTNLLFLLCNADEWKLWIPPMWYLFPKVGFQLTLEPETRTRILLAIAPWSWRHFETPPQLLVRRKYQKNKVSWIFDPEHLAMFLNVLPSLLFFYQFSLAWLDTFKFSKVNESSNWVKWGQMTSNGFIFTFHSTLVPYRRSSLLSRLKSVI